MAKSQIIFLLSYYLGASWDESIAYEDQPGLMKHHAYVRDLHINDLIVMVFRRQKLPVTD